MKRKQEYSTQHELSKREGKARRQEENKIWKARDRKVWSEIDANTRHTEYFRQQLPELDDDEWRQLLFSMSLDLPVTFRICRQRNPCVSVSLLYRMMKEFRQMSGRFIEVKGEVVNDVVQPILTSISSKISAFKIAADSSTLSHSPGLQPLHQLLCREVRLGNIVRQEVVSMIPAILLNIHHHHRILDVCAAPGSKTEQLLSLMQEDAILDGLEHYNAKGLLVANDADPKRIETLRERYRNCRSPQLIITSGRGEDLERAIRAPFFDRILCDVPCSGDGTFRKSPHLWRLFRPRTALELHLIQLQIAISSVLMLKKGGLMAYSTCSINCLEDEAVICGLLKIFKGKLRIVDTNFNAQTGFKCRPGVSKWHCDKQIFSVGEESESARRETISMLPPLQPSMYCPTKNEAIDMHLDKTLRFLHHDEDTGGFFVAILELVEDISMEERRRISSGDFESIINSSCSSSSSSSLSSSVSSPEKRMIGVKHASKVMKNLGYNPKFEKSSCFNGGTTKLNESEFPVMTRCDDMHDFSSISDGLGLMFQPNETMKFVTTQRHTPCSNLKMKKNSSISVNVEACVLSYEALEFIKRVGIPNRSLIQIGSSVVVQRKRQWCLESSNIQLLKSITHSSNHVKMHTLEMYFLLESCMKIADNRDLKISKDSCQYLFKANTLSALFDNDIHSENDSYYMIITCKPHIDYPQIDQAEKEFLNLGKKNDINEGQGRQRISKALRKKMKKLGSTHCTTLKEKDVTNEESVNGSYDVLPIVLSKDMDEGEAQLLIRIQRLNQHEVIEEDVPFLQMSSSIDTCVSLYEALRTFISRSSTHNSSTSTSSCTSSTSSSTGSLFGEEAGRL